MFFYFFLLISLNFNPASTADELRITLGEEIMASGKEVTPGFNFTIEFEITNISSNTSIDRPLLGSVEDANISLYHIRYLSSDSRIVLRGPPGTKAVFTIRDAEFPSVNASFNVTLLVCPPLFTLNEKQLCVCGESLYNVMLGDITKCSFLQKEGFIQQGYWIGYDKKVEVADENSLLVGYCPTNSCFKRGNTTQYHRLIPRANKKELDEIICAPNRTGLLCSQCKPGYTVYFHSDSFLCMSNSGCKHVVTRIFLYFVSVILPQTILFLAIVMSNINLASSQFNGIVFFAQVTDLNSDLGGTFMQYSYQALQIGHKLVHKTLNFDFFAIDELSFCLMKDTRTIDIIAMKFLSVIYGLFLLLFTVLFIKYGISCICWKWLRIKLARASMIHGLTTFLILVYAQCIKVAFLIINTEYVYNKSTLKYTLVYSQGDMRYMEAEHKKYAIPTFFLLIGLALLPVLLLLYPLSYKLVFIFNLERFYAVRSVIDRIPIVKLKPLFDSFQGSYKDKYRFFAGLYFVYRVTVILSRFCYNFAVIYVANQIQFTSMLFLHLLAWPYERMWHNVIDAMLFFNLSLINALNMMQYMYVHHFSQNMLTSAEHVLLILLYLPIFAFAGRYLVAGVLKLRKCLKRNASEYTRDDSFFMNHVNRSLSPQEGVDNYYLAEGNDSIL